MQGLPGSRGSGPPGRHMTQSAGAAQLQHGKSVPSQLTPSVGGAWAEGQMEATDSMSKYLKCFKAIDRANKLLKTCSPLLPWHMNHHDDLGGQVWT